MSYVILGSVTSPFVRRIRMLLADLPHELRSINIFEGPGMVELQRVNPIKQIPVLLDDGQPVWDSRIIFQHLNRKHQWETMDLDKENRLTAIEGALDAGIALMLLKRSGCDLEQPLMYVQRQKDRIRSVLDWITPWAQGPEAKLWSFSSMSLYAALDWMEFREIYPVNQHPGLQGFLETHREHPVVVATDPRKG